MPEGSNNLVTLFQSALAPKDERYTYYRRSAVSNHVSIRSRPEGREILWR